MSLFKIIRKSEPMLVEILGEKPFRILFDNRLFSSPSELSEIPTPYDYDLFAYYQEGDMFYIQRNGEISFMNVNAYEQSGKTVFCITDEYFQPFHNDLKKHNGDISLFNEKWSLSFDTDIVDWFHELRNGENMNNYILVAAWYEDDKLVSDIITSSDPILLGLKNELYVNKPGLLLLEDINTYDTEHGREIIIEKETPVSIDRASSLTTMDSDEFARMLTATYPKMIDNQIIISEPVVKKTTSASLDI